MLIYVLIYLAFNLLTMAGNEDRTGPVPQDENAAENLKNEANEFFKREFSKSII